MIDYQLSCVILWHCNNINWCLTSFIILLQFCSICWVSIIEYLRVSINIKWRLIIKSNHSVIIWKGFSPFDWWNLFTTFLYALSFGSELTDFIWMRNSQIIWCWKWSCRLNIEWFHTVCNFRVYFYDFTCICHLNKIRFTNFIRWPHTKNKELFIKKLEISKNRRWRWINFVK